MNFLSHCRETILSSSAAQVQSTITTPKQQLKAIKTKQKWVFFRSSKQERDREKSPKELYNTSE